MSFLSIIPQYISWHYTKGFLNLFILYKNFSWFFWNLFSIKFLFKNLFFPFKRLDVRNKGFNPEAFFESLVTNLIMRIIGFLFRSVVIILGLVSIFILSIVSFLILFIWIVLPFIILGMMILGLITMFRDPIS